MASWREARYAARWRIGTLEALLDKVHQSNLILDIPTDTPIPPRPWQSTGPPRNPFLSNLLPHDVPVPFPSPTSPVTGSTSALPSGLQTQPLLHVPRGFSLAQLPRGLAPSQTPRRSSPSDTMPGTHLHNTPRGSAPPDAPRRPLSDGMVLDLAPPSPVSSSDLDWEGSGSDSPENPDYEMSEGSDAQGSGFYSDGP